MRDQHLTRISRAGFVRRVVRCLFQDADRRSVRAFDNGDHGTHPAPPSPSRSSTIPPRAASRKGGRAWHIKAAPLLAVLVVLAAVALTACQPRHVDVLVYGDSLTVNAQEAHGLVAPGKTIAVRAKGGTALCDWVPEMAADRKDFQPKTVVVALAGNVATCVSNDFLRRGAAGATANYERALRAVRKAFPTERIVVISPIAAHDLIGWFPYLGSSQLVAMYKRVAAEIHATYSLAADDALTPHHIFTWKRPPLGCPRCRPVTVRTQEGVHLTIAGGLLYGAALLK